MYESGKLTNASTAHEGFRTTPRVFWNISAHDEMALIVVESPSLATTVTDDTYRVATGITRGEPLGGA